MPPKRKPKPQSVIYTDSYPTEGQSITSNGDAIRMPNGRLFKRTVLPKGEGLDIHKRMEQAEVIDLNQQYYDPDA